MAYNSSFQMTLFAAQSMTALEITSYENKVVIQETILWTEWCFNAPTINNVTIVIVSQEQYDHHDMIIQKWSKILLWIPETHLLYNILRYPLIL